MVVVSCTLRDEAGDTSAVSRVQAGLVAGPSPHPVRRNGERPAGRTGRGGLFGPGLDRGGAARHAGSGGQLPAAGRGVFRLTAWTLRRFGRCVRHELHGRHGTLDRRRLDLATSVDRRWHRRRPDGARAERGLGDDRQVPEHRHPGMFEPYPALGGRRGDLDRAGHGAGVPLELRHTGRRLGDLHRVAGLARGTAREHSGRQAERGPRWPIRAQPARRSPPRSGSPRWTRAGWPARARAPRSCPPRPS